MPVVVCSAGHYHESINIFQSTKPRNRERGVISIEIRSKKGPPSIVLIQVNVMLSYDLCSLFPSLLFLPFFFCFPFRFLRFPTISCYGSGPGCFATRGRSKSIILKTADIQNSSRNLCFLYLLLPFIPCRLGC